VRPLRQLWLALAIAAPIPACTSEGPGEPAAALPAVEDPGPVKRATLEELKGEVTVKRATDDAWQRALEGMPLFDNDKVRTSRNASAQIHFATGSVLAMGDDALVGIAEERPAPSAIGADVTVLRGRIDARLPDPRTQSITVTTPSATVRAGREIVFQ
jgi:FecR protein